jgi:hypothetical protein
MSAQHHHTVQNKFSVVLCVNKLFCEVTTLRVQVCDNTASTHCCVLQATKVHKC